MNSPCLEFWLNLGSTQSISDFYQISTQNIKAQNLHGNYCCLKTFLSFSPSTSTTKICKAYFSTIPWWPCKICYSGSQKMEANLIFSVNHLIHPLAPIILKPLLHQNFTQSVRKLKITAENFHANEN